MLSRIEILRDGKSGNCNKKQSEFCLHTTRGEK